MFHCLSSLNLFVREMDSVKVLQSISWQPIGAGNSIAHVQLSTELFFSIKRVSGDGNCFYRSLSAVLDDSLSEENHLHYRFMVAEAARVYFSEEPESKLTGMSLEEYIEQATKPGEWAGSLEASMISKFLEITIIIWSTNESGVIVHGMRFGKDDPRLSYHLLLSGNTHFDALSLKDLITAEDSSVSLLSKLEAIEEIIQEEDTLGLTRSKESGVQNNSTKPEEGLAALPRLVDKGENIPLRVGRIIEMFFCCRLGFHIKDEQLVIANIAVYDHKDVFSINKLGHMILSNDRTIKREFSKLTLIIDSSVLEYLDIGTLLRFSFPGKGLNRMIPFVLESLILEILQTNTSILLSTFLYKSKPKQKKEFIANCCQSSLVGFDKINRVLKKLKFNQLSNNLSKIISDVCQELYGVLIDNIAQRISRLDGTSLLYLRNTDFSCLSLNNYLKLLEDLEREDNKDTSLGNREISSLHDLRVKLQTLEEKGPECMSIWYKDWRPSKKVDDRTRAKQKIIKDFFEEREITKFVSHTGKASGNFQIGNVLSYAYNLYLCSSSFRLNEDDLNQLTIEIRNLSSLQDNKICEPVSLICEKLESHFFKAFEILPTDCRDECTLLFEDIRNSVSHAVAWKHALRLKGAMYEGFFSDQYNWTYLPEDLKPSLIMAIQTLFPDKFIDFLERTQLHPEFRDLTPDFLLTQRIVLEEKIHIVGEETQLKIKCVEEDTVAAIPTSKTTFPLPEVSIQEVNSIERIRDLFLNKVESNNSMKNRFNFSTNDYIFDLEEGFSKHQLLFVEIGYQTDVEGKVFTDTIKWKEVLKLLSLVGIKASLIVCVDNSQTHAKDWWIKEDRVRLLKDSISHLFAKLGSSSPTDITDIVVGSISTQKIRSFLKSGSNTKTPVSYKDVKETWVSMKEFITKRPTGVVLPATAETQLEAGMVTGTIISDEGAASLIECLKSHDQQIADEFEKTRYKNEVNQYKTTSSVMLLEWLLEDLEACRCYKCFTTIRNESLNMPSLESKITHIAKSCVVTSHLVCCHSIQLDLKKESCVDQRTPNISDVTHHETISLDDDDVIATELDKLIRVTLPGKTEKEKKIKRSVDCLIKLMMIESGLECIKLTNGQLITIDSSTKRNILGESPESKSGSGKQCGTTNRKETIIKNLQEDKLKDYSNHVKKVIKQSLERIHLQDKAKCALPKETMNKILGDLKVPLKNEEIINNIRETFMKRRKYSRNNDKLLIRSPFEIIEYVQWQGKKLYEPPNMCFTVDCLLFKEVTYEAMMRYWSTAYHDCPEYIVQLINFLLNFTWYQEIVLYAKICETFLRICTEFNRAGVKLLRVRHTDVNIAVKLPSNKKKNMYCALYDSKMTLIKPPFFLNRRQAILGGAYPYILATLYMQVLQQHRCVEILLSDPNKYLDAIRNKTLDYLEVFKKEINFTLNGQFESVANLKLELCKKTGNFLTKSGFETFITTITGLNMVYGLIMKGSFLANSLPQNKQLQMLRYGMLNGLSKISCPKELGRKFSSSCRRIEDNLSRIYLQSVVYCCCRDPEYNIKGWKENDICPTTSLTCFSVYGYFVTSDRQLIFDIYNVHIYNKEMDDFEDGCIQVLEETASRHMNWENKLKEAINSDNKRITRLLLGAPNVQPCECSDLMEGQGQGRSKEKNRKNSREEPYDYKSEEDTKSKASSKISRRSSISQRSTTTGSLSTYNTIKKTITLLNGFSVMPDTLRQGRPAITGSSNYLTYTPSKTSVLKDILTIIKLNPNYTLGSFELIQAATEFAKFKYPPESIINARKNPKNWISISEVTETTSIISAPKTVYSLKEALEVSLTSDTKKVAKMLRNKLKKLGSLFTDNDASKRECIVLLETVEGLTGDQKANIVNAIFTPSKLALYNWKSIVNKDLKETLLSHDGNIIYCWIKSLSLMVKSQLTRHLKFMNPGAAPIQNHALFSDEELQALLNVKTLLTSTSDEIYTLSQPLLQSSWRKTFDLNVSKLPPIKDLFEDLDSLCENLYLIKIEHSILQNSKRNNKFTSFVREEMKIKNMERTFLNSNGGKLVKFCNLIFYTAVSAPWCFHYKALESYLVRHPELLDISLNSEANHLSGLTVSSMLVGIYSDYHSGITVRQRLTFKFLVDYIVTLFSSNTEPFSICVADDSKSIGHRETNDIEERLLYQTKKIFAKLGLSDRNYDFIWTVQMIANSNFNVCRKLTGRSEGEKLPRSIRSKVVYEMVKLVGETNMAMLQQIAFSKSLNYKHRFFSVLAPKAQLGGCRDLLVQETDTKIIHATTEMFSRTLLNTTSDDGLTNPHLKETILGVGLDALTVMRKQDGKNVDDKSTDKIFFRVFCISGDNTKWGPIHCCSFFSGMMQQLLKNHQDWVSFYKIAFIKNLCRQIEIPASSLRKIINVLKYKFGNSMELDKLSEAELRNLLIKSEQEWENLPHVQFIIDNYLSRGHLAMNSYNHMGQGIHHATSSILTSIMSELFEELTISYFRKHFPELIVKVSHAGSSDDYAKVVTFSGTVSREQYTLYNNIFWQHVCRFKNYISAVNRCCQMKDSAKTLTGDCFLEFYSEFMMGRRITPAVIKFIFTGLINSSVTSPSSLAQACHVSSQQAMYNSVPMLTNISFTLFRQQTFFNHVEAFIRRYGPITLGSVSQFGRLYCPRYSNLIGSSITLEDCELISGACSHIIEQDILFSTSNFDNNSIHNQTANDSSESTSSETSSFKSENLLSFEGTCKLTEEDLRFMRANHESNRYTDTMAITKLVEDWYTNSKDSTDRYKDKIMDSVLVNSCNWLLIAKKKCFMEVIKNLQMLLRIICIGRYRSFSSHGIEKVLKASLCRDENQIIEDPMIQLLPEKLRRELDRLGLSRMTVDELLPNDFSTATIMQVVAQKLISLNVATESYSAEVSRLKQTLTARNVLYGLAGGIKELSVPIYTIFLKSYFFKDNLFYDLFDRWPTQKSTNYRDSTGKKLDGQVVTKYQHWLGVILNCTLSVDRTSNVTDRTLFNDSLKCIDVLKRIDGLTDLSLILSHLEVCKNELNSIVIQFSDNNRMKLKVVESRPPEYEMEANKAVIVKSSLFSGIDSIKLKNNPAVVIGYLLDEASISEVKPTKIDFANLMKDKFKISQYFPSVDKVVSELKKESDNYLAISSKPDLEVATKYINYLTLLSRMLLQTCSKLTVFYMIKGNTLRNEPTVSDLVSYGIKEGRYLSLPDVSLDISTFSVKYWKVLHCLAGIGNLPVSDSVKREIFLGFMNWKVSIDCLCIGCSLVKYEKNILEEFSGHTIVNSLASEINMIKDTNERESVHCLVNFVVSPAELLKYRPTVGRTSNFRSWGDGKKNGRFTFSSSSGEASGIFVGSKMHIHLSEKNDHLLNEVERNVLSWLYHRRTEVLTIDQHEVFLDLLPTLREAGGKGSDGKPYSVMIDFSNPKYLKLREASASVKNCIIRVKRSILTTRKSKSDEPASDPKLKWSKRGISIVFEVLETETLYHEGILKVRELIGKLKGKNLKLPSVAFSDTEYEIARIKFPDTLLINSLSLLHTFLLHSRNQIASVPTIKSNVLKEYLRSGYIKQIEMLKKYNLDKSLKLIYNTDAVKDDDDTVYRELSKLLTESYIPLHWWTEVQYQTYSLGFSDFLLTYSESPSFNGVRWDIKSSLIQTDNRIPDLRRLLSTLKAGVVPSCFSPYIVNSQAIEQLLNLAKSAMEELMSKSISNSTMDFIILMTLFCFQSEKPTSDPCIYFAADSLLSLMSSDSINIGPKLVFKAIVSDSQISIEIKLKCLEGSELLLSQDEKARLVRRSIRVALDEFFFKDGPDLQFIKDNFSNLQFTTDKETSTSYITFTIDFWSAHLVDYTSSIKVAQAGLSACKTSNFVLFLMGLRIGNDVVEDSKDRAIIQEDSDFLSFLLQTETDPTDGDCLEDTVSEANPGVSSFFSDDEY
ncbi:RNA-dependent RNA polymerase [Wufeng Crocidura attenuata orthonairovirus 1]|uniref:RNA-directed RNA polymerase L n=1 Tax=Wufeng Crocidura attenuata orthonairovirus 1 TaxID=2929009 RepID=A0A8T9KN41_9VIRU|nr:RNA-dependent RNA polymerase [Wufeng Crocidura attenuata orthonairovirus 1]